MALGDLTRLAACLILYVTALMAVSHAPVETAEDGITTGSPT